APAPLPEGEGRSYLADLPRGYASRSPAPGDKNAGVAAVIVNGGGQLVEAGSNDPVSRDFLLRGADLHDHVATRTQSWARLRHHSVKDAKSIRSAIQCRMRFVVTNPWGEAGNIAMWNVGRIAENKIERLTGRHCLE